MLRFIGFYDYTVILTYMSLISAFLGMIFASQGNFVAAVLCLMASGVCDAFDGTVARSKKNRTDDEKAFGIQLDSLCDVISFGAFPAFLCYCLGMKSIPAVLILCGYCICAVIRLAFFNVIEGKRQQTEGGCNKMYRGLPVTSISFIFPIMFSIGSFLPGGLLLPVLHVTMAAVAFLFILDIPIKKLDVSKLTSVK